MNGRLFIDGHDAYTDYGVYVVQGGWNELIAMPPLKAVEYNDWHEDNGIEVDLSEPVLDTREVVIMFAMKDVYNDYNSFVELLSDNAYHTFDCVYIGRVYRLRMVGMPWRVSEGSMSVLSIKFADDFPLYNYTYKMPIRTILQEVTYLIDDKSLSNYNVRVLRGTLASLTKMPDVKPNLLINSSTQSGASYDNSEVTFKGKDVVLSCLMTADDLTTLWRNYDALLYDLTRPNARMFGGSRLEDTYPCYYKSCQVEDFYPDEGKAWLVFHLTLTFYEGSIPVLLPNEARRIEYLEGNKQPYINTGLPATLDGIIVDMDVYIEDDIDYEATTPTGVYKIFFGGPRYDDNGTSTSVTMYVALQYNRSTEQYSAVLALGGRSFAVRQNFFDQKINVKIDGINHTFSVNGITYTPPNTFNWSTTKQGNLCLFRRGDSTSGAAKSKFYRAKFSNSSGVLRDYIPVQVGDVGYLYDRVTKQFYGNAYTSGAFICGTNLNNEEAYISRVEYIEGTGTQYIDTGISLYGCTDIDISMEVSPTALYNYVALFGACPLAHKATECWIPSTGKISMRIAAANTSYKVVSDVTAVIGERYKICASLHDRINTLTVNDNVVQSSIGSDTVTDDFNLTLLHRDGNTTTGKVRLYPASVKTGNEVRFDFVPVRVGNTGYFYDKMSGLLFGSASEDAFVAGRDI